MVSPHVGTCPQIKDFMEELVFKNFLEIVLRSILIKLFPDTKNDFKWNKIKKRFLNP